MEMEKGEREGQGNLGASRRLYLAWGTSSRKSVSPAQAIRHIQGDGRNTRCFGRCKRQSPMHVSTGLGLGRADLSSGHPVLGAMPRPILLGHCSPSRRLDCARVRTLPRWGRPPAWMQCECAKTSDAAVPPRSANLMGDRGDLTRGGERASSSVASEDGAFLPTAEVAASPRVSCPSGVRQEISSRQRLFARGLHGSSTRNGTLSATAENHQ